MASNDNTHKNFMSPFFVIQVIGTGYFERLKGENGF